MKIADRRFVITLLTLIIAWVFVYKEALLGMESIWSRSDTFAHGYFILPISLWLIWRDKSYLFASKTQVSWLALPMLVGSLFVGLFAFAADINVLGQLSAVTSLIFLLWLMIGNNLAWRYKFPLAYLLFAVPMGESLIPWLQDVTAWFTVFFLKLNGIPVYVDGLYIQVPTGMFEVAVACSGIRYLIASAAVGALYGYLTYTKLSKQLIFFVFALTLPILANGIRAYGIVAIAYYSDMKYATGVDHLIYGWMFFGLIIMLMFWLGGFFADKQQPEKVNETASVEGSPERMTKSFYSASSATVALLLFAIYLVQSIPSVVVSDKELSEKANTPPSSWGINYAHALHKSMALTASNVEVFRAIYANKQSQGEMISWENITHNHDAWTVVSTKVLLVDGNQAEFVHLRSISGIPRSYLYQYKVGNSYTVNKNKAKLMQAWNGLSRQSDFSEVRAVSFAGESDFDKVEVKLLDAFINHSFPEIDLGTHLGKGQ